MPNYTVQPGDCISSIAKQYGFLTQTLWQHGGNSELRKKRKNPNILFPGDQVYIPDKQPKEVSRPTGQLHKFVKRIEKVNLRLRLLQEGEPRAGVKYTLTVEGEKYSGQTDGNGRLEQLIPADARTGQLSTPDAVYDLAIGKLDPVAETTGIQQRLKNMGYTAETADGDVKDATRAALKRFQRDHGLEPTGELSQATRDQLEGLHGC